MTYENGIDFSAARAESPFNDPNRMGGTVPELPNAENQTLHTLDKPAAANRYKQLKEWYEQERDRQASNRYQQALDEDYYDGLQWTEEDAQVLLNRGQAPLVFNEIKPTLDWITGTERRTRIDYKVLARKKDATEIADQKTQLLKYLSDVNNTVFHRSRAFKDAVAAGVGWLETGVRGDGSDDPLYTRYESWRNVLYDSNSIEQDLADARYVFRWKWLDEDVALAYFPDRTAKIRASAKNTANINGYDANDEFWYMGARVTQPGQDYTVNMGRYKPYDGSPFQISRRTRVKLVEAWYRIPTLVRYFANGDLQHTPFDSKNPEHITALKGGYSLYDRLTMQIRCAIFCDDGLLFDGPSPYKHEKLPFVPIWCYRRRRDNAPYGIVRGLRDPQDDLNKRASKSLWILSSNRVIAEKGAVDDWDELREEVARPDSLIVKNPGKQLEIDRDVQLAEEHLKLMERNVEHIRNVGGVTSENLGRQTNANSGVAIQSRQEQGTVVTTEPFDNLRFAVQLLGQMELSNVEQFYTAEKTVRILGDRGGAKYIELNKQMPDGSILNDITADEADFVVSQQDYRSTLRQAMFESMFDITTRLAQMNPQIALNLLDLVVEMADLPNKDELVQRIRQMSGMKDPDEEVPPEVQQQQEMAAQQQAQQAQAMQQQAIQLELAEKEAKVKETQARAEKLMADAQAVMANLQNAGAAGDVQQKFQDQINQINQQAQERVNQLINQVAQLQVDQKNRNDEIAARHQAELNKANASKEATIEAARINAEAMKEVEAGKRETEKAIAEAQANTDKAMETLTKQLEAVTSAMTKQIEQIASATTKQIDDLGKKLEKAEPKEAAPQVINLTVDAKPAEPAKRRTITLKKDKAGNVTGMDVKEDGNG